MDTRQRSVGSRHSQHSSQYDTLGDDKKRRPQRSRGWCRIILLATVTPILLLVVYYNLLAAEDSLPVAFSLRDPPRLEGLLKPNDHLLLADILYEGKVLGPESMEFDHGHLYTGTSDGKVVHIYKGEVSTLATLGKPPCGGYENEATCGRPLGMRLDADGYLTLCDAVLGVYKLNVATGDSHLLLPSSVNIEGRSMSMLNDLDIDDDGTIYFTDTSRYHRRDYVLDFLDGRGTGRLIRYDPVRNATEVLLNNLHFANGVQLSRYNDYLLVAETTRARIIKYHLKGVRAGHAEVFADNLPCLPDNIRRSSAGGYWVACSVSRYEGMPFNGLDLLATRPWIRWLVMKLSLPTEWMSKAFSSSTMILELDGRGAIRRALMDLRGERVLWSSEVHDDAGTLYIGSFREPYIARLLLDRLPSVDE